MVISVNYGCAYVFSRLSAYLSYIFNVLQGQHDELEAKFFEERAALEAKYQKLYEPLYTKVHSFILLRDHKSVTYVMYYNPLQC